MIDMTPFGPRSLQIAADYHQNNGSTPATLNDNHHDTSAAEAARRGIEEIQQGRVTGQDQNLKNAANRTRAHQNVFGA